MGEPKKITELWAWVVTEADGGEGVPATSGLIDGYMLPLMGADEARVRSVRSEAIRIADIDGLPLKLLRFTNAEVFEVHRHPPGKVDG